LLERGTVSFAGTPAEAFQRYRGSVQHTGFSAANRIHSSDFLRITNGALTVEGVPTDTLLSSMQPELHLTLEVFKPVAASFEVLLRDASSAPVMFGPIGLAQGFSHPFQPGVYSVRFKLLLPRLAEGRYSLDLMVVRSGKQFYDYLEDAIVINAAAESNPHTGWQFTQARGQGCILLETTLPEISGPSPSTPL
jgi:hypothetical protein